MSWFQAKDDFKRLPEVVVKQCIEYRVYAGVDVSQPDYGRLDVYV